MLISYTHTDSIEYIVTGEQRKLLVVLLMDKFIIITRYRQIKHDVKTKLCDHLDTKRKYVLNVLYIIAFFNLKKTILMYHVFFNY